MGLPRLRPLPSILLAITVLAELSAVGLSWGLEPAWDTLLYAVSAPLTVGTGALILSRHPRHAVGWLLCVLGLVNALTGDLPQGWVSRCSRGVGRRASYGMARAVELAAGDALVGGDPPAVPHRSPAKPPLVDGCVAGRSPCFRSLARSCRSNASSSAGTKLASGRASPFARLLPRLTQVPMETRPFRRLAYGSPVASSTSACAARSGYSLSSLLASRAT